MSGFRNKLRVEKFFNKWRLTEPLLYIRHNGSAILVPDRFVTDKTSYYFEGKWTRASILHDYLIKSNKYSRDYADEIMREAMKSLDVDIVNYTIISIGIWVGNKMDWFWFITNPLVICVEYIVCMFAKIRNRLR